MIKSIRQRYFPSLPGTWAFGSIGCPHPIESRVHQVSSISGYNPHRLDSVLVKIHYLDTFLHYFCLVYSKYSNNEPRCYIYPIIDCIHTQRHSLRNHNIEQAFWVDEHLLVLVIERFFLFSSRTCLHRSKMEHYFIDWRLNKIEFTWPWLCKYECFLNGLRLCLCWWAAYLCNYIQCQQFLPFLRFEPIQLLYRQAVCHHWRVTAGRGYRCDARQSFGGGRRRGGGLLVVAGS